MAQQVINGVPQGMRLPASPAVAGVAIAGTGAAAGQPLQSAMRPVAVQQVPAAPVFNSTRISDISPKAALDEPNCRKRLTTYEAHSVQKLPGKDSKDKPTWARVQLVRESFSSDEVGKIVKKLDDGKSAATKKANLFPYQQGQVTKLLDDLNTAEQDRNFIWTLAQIDRKEAKNKDGKLETRLMTVYVKRSVVDSVSAVAIFQAIERYKADRAAALNRPGPQLVGPSAGAPSAATGAAGAPASQLVRLNPQQQQPQPMLVSKGAPRSRGRDKDSSVSSEFDSSTDSDSEYSSIGTSISSRSRRGRRYSHSHRGRSRSRHREHVKRYYITERVHSPEPRYRDTWHGTAIQYVPELPRVAAPAGFDPVSAAYQAGKLDADAERAERFAAAPPALLEASPRAVITYERNHSRPRARTGYHQAPLYLDDRRLDHHGGYRDRYGQVFHDRRFEDRFARGRLIDDHALTRDRLQRREREVEDYISRRPSPRIIYDPADHPFAPRRYPASLNSDW